VHNAKLIHPSDKIRAQELTTPVGAKSPYPTSVLPLNVGEEVTNAISSVLLLPQEEAPGEPGGCILEQEHVLSSGASRLVLKLPEKIHANEGERGRRPCRPWGKWQLGHLPS
jgi:hypothetical protein